MLRRGLTQKKKTLTYTHSMKNSLLFRFIPMIKGKKLPLTKIKCESARAGCKKAQSIYEVIRLAKVINKKMKTDNACR